MKNELVFWARSSIIILPRWSRRLSRSFVTSVILTLITPALLYIPDEIALAAGASAPVGSTRLQFLTVNDPVYGVEMGKLAFFAGWQGTVGVTRNDAACPDCNSVSLNMTSPEGRSQIQTYGEGLHTGLNQLAGQKGHFARTRFTSTGELITQYILPALHLDGQPSAPRPSLVNQAAAALEEMKRGPIFGTQFTQGAAVRVSGGSSGKDYVIEALTLGGSLGAPTEFTVTHFTVIQAPAEQADALATAWEALPPISIHPEWRRLNDEHTMATLKRMQAQQQQQNAQVQQWMRDYNARQAAFNSSQLSSNAAARQAQQRRADQSQQDAQQAQRNITDTGNQVIDSRNGNSRYYTFCNSQTGQVVYQYNTTVPPDTSGHWLRCGSD
jgi:hypothetical protein